MIVRLSPLLAYTDNGAGFLAAIEKRLKPLRRTLHELCEISGVDYSTTYRWGKGSIPTLETVKRLEAVFQRWERIAQSSSISSKLGKSPAARL